MIITNRGKHIFLPSNDYLNNILIEKFIFTAHIYLVVPEKVAFLAKKNLKNCHLKMKIIAF